jgi:GcrA cell cycle regulator
MRWNDERTAALKRLWADGFSCSQIAGRLGGVTRNGVIGKIHRLGLAGRATKSRIKYSRRVPPKGQPKPKSKGKPFVFVTSPNMVRSPPMEPAPLPMPAADDKARISFADLDLKHCKWPVGDPAAVGAHEPLFCGLDRMGLPGIPVSAYCAGHHARAYTPVRPRTPPAVSAPAPVVERELEAA